MWFPLEMVVFDMHEVPHKSWRGKSALVTYAFKTFLKKWFQTKSVKPWRGAKL